MGKWYVVEIFDHKEDPKHMNNVVTQVVDSCPIVTLKPFMSSRSSNLQTSRPFEYINEVKLLWTEERGNLEYTFRTSEKGRYGSWRSVGTQNGIF